MPLNPYRLADTRQRSARLRAEGLAGRLGPLLPMFSAGVAIWLARDVYATVLGAGPNLDPRGYATLMSRVGICTAAALSLSAYDAVIRGPDRGVVDHHPLLGEAWLRSVLLRLVRERLPWLAAGWIALVPLLPHVQAFLLGGVAVAGAWAAGIGVGIGVNVAAPGVGANPKYAPIFDALRGANPRLHAALLYAPGVALAGSGLATLAGTWGAARLIEGGWDGALGLACAPVASFAGWRLALRHTRSLAGTTAILGEIDAAWAAVDTVNEARTVYLEWTVRLVPDALRLALRKELRHLSRGHRAWVTGSWGIGLLVAVAAWTSAHTGAARYGMVGGAGIVAVAYAGVRLGAGDPDWLRLTLPVQFGRTARWLALILALQPVILPGAVTLGLRQGAAFVLPLCQLEGLAVGLALAGVLAGRALRHRGALLYAPVAVVAWAGVVG